MSTCQEGDTKLEWFLNKNQHTQRKLLNFENWFNPKTWLWQEDTGYGYGVHSFNFHQNFSKHFWWKLFDVSFHQIFLGKLRMIEISEGIKYSNQEYTRVGYPILGYFRVQVPVNLWKTSLSSFKLARKFSSKLGT